MCGRFALSIIPARFQLVFECEAPPDYEPHWNIVPDLPILTVLMRDGERRARPLFWGLLPPWARDPKDKGRQINARSESVFDKRMFKDAVLRGRCLIPADGFYEWQRGEGPSQPFFIRRKDGEPMALAGIRRRRHFDEGEVESCAVLTMAAHETIAGIHHRMPVMLPPELWSAWLDPANDERGTVEPLIRVLEPEAIEAYEVSRAVNNPRNDDARLVEPARAQSTPPEQPRLL